MPVSGNVLVDKKKLMELVDQLRLAIPQEVKAAAEVLSQKDHIISQANLDARRTKAQAEDEYSLLYTSPSPRDKRQTRKPASA